MFSLRNDFPWPTLITGHHRFSERHRFNNDHTEGLYVRCMNNNIHSLHPMWDIALITCLKNMTVQVALPDEIGDLIRIFRLKVVFATDDNRTDIRTTPSYTADGLHKHMNALPAL